MRLAADDMQTWLMALLRQRGAWRSSLTLKVNALPAAEIPDLGVRYLGDPPPPPPVESIGFRIQLVAHRTTRGDAEAILAQVKRTIEEALATEILPASAEYEGSGEASALEADVNAERFSLSFPVYLGVEAPDDAETPRQ